jgi:diacylglycerol kinase
MNLSKFIRSFRIGILGFCHAVRAEQNMRIHCLAALVVIVAACVLKLVVWEWVAISLCIGLVISAECMNTALERLADRVSGETDPLIKHAKDCGSAAVLVLAATSAAVGGVIFVPKLWSVLGW